MSPEEKEKIINDVIDVVDGVDVTDCHLSDYQRMIVEDFAKDDPIVKIGRKDARSWVNVLIWLQYMYIMIYGVFPTYNELVEFAHDVSMDSRKVKTENYTLYFSIGNPKERTIADVKKDIKHEKNPMRLKQLNKELNKLYKEKKKRGRNKCIV